MRYLQSPGRDDTAQHARRIEPPAQHARRIELPAQHARRIKPPARRARMQSPTPFLDLFFPRRCPVCDRPVKPFGALICEECSKVPVPVGDSVCMKCGKPVEPEEEYCADCRTRPHLYYRGMAVYRYRSVSGSLYRFKYDGRREYADFYGEGMARAMDQFLSETGGQHAPELLIPVPCSRQRLRKRGYNQAALLARSLSERTGIPAAEDLLVRSRDTRAMRSMSAAERQINLKRTFHVYGNGVRLKSIMLIDDIFTTGATVDACAVPLLEAGAKEVSFLTLAIGENSI